MCRTVLVEKHWREPVKRSLCEAFMGHVTARGQSSEGAPLLSIGAHTVLYLRRGEIYLLGVVTRARPAPALSAHAPAPPDDRRI